MTKVIISVINFNGAKATIECLKTIDELNIDKLEVEVIVLDNGSTEKFDQEDVVLHKIPFEFIKSKENLGFAGGHNLIFKRALKKMADYVLVLNNDVVLDQNCLQELINSFKPGVGIVSPKIYFAKGYEFHKDRYQEKDLGKVIWYAGGEMDWKNVLGVHRGVDEVDSGQFDKEVEIDFASGCCMLFSKEVLERIGVFDERYFLYYEDNDLSQRVKKNGFKIMFTPKAFLWHKNAASAGGSGSNLQDYYISRNRLLFGLRFAPPRAKIALIRESLKILIGGRKWQKKGVADFYLRKFGKGSYK